MSRETEAWPRCSPVGESALLFELGEVLDPDLNARVHALDAWLQKSPLAGFTHAVPGYVSLLVGYDPLETSQISVTDWLQDQWESCPQDIVREAKRIEIQVCYGGDAGPDLEAVARYHQIATSEVVRRHVTPVYLVGMMGFTPGFAYLLGLDPLLETPRKAQPRIAIPAGSVGIAGGQTGIYPLDSPGGWQLIGKTDAVLFDPDRQQPFLLSPGDEVCFVVAEESVVK